MNIELLFQERAESFALKTEEILESISHIIEGITQFLYATEELAQGKLTWEDIILEDDIIMLTGMIEYPPGARFTTSEGEQMIVSEQTKDYFTRMIRLGLPLKIVKIGTTEDIIQFLTNIDKEKKSRDVLPTELLDINGFDLSELTEEQAQALLDLKTPSTGGIH